MQPRGEAAIFASRGKNTALCTRAIFSRPRADDDDYDDNDDDEDDDARRGWIPKNSATVDGEQLDICRFSFSLFLSPSLLARSEQLTKSRACVTISRRVGFACSSTSASVSNLLRP